MLSVKGHYENGKIKILEKLSFHEPADVIITFLDKNISSEAEKGMEKKFSFDKTSKVLKKINGNLANEIIQERRES